MIIVREVGVAGAQPKLRLHWGQASHAMMASSAVTEGWEQGILGNPGGGLQVRSNEVVRVKLVAGAWPRLEAGVSRNFRESFEEFTKSSALTISKLNLFAV